MKNLFLAALMLVSITTFAQDKKPRGERQKLTSEQKVDLQVKKMTTELNLDEKQAKELRAIVTKEVEKREAKRAEAKEQRAKDRAEMKAKMEKEQAYFSGEMKKVLTAEQFAKWEKQREERKAKMKEKAGQRGRKGDFRKIEEDK